MDYTCSINGSTSSTVRWSANETTLYTFVVPGDVGRVQIAVIGVIGTVVNTTTLSLSVNLGGVDPNIFTNGTEISCVEVSGGTLNVAEALTVIGNEHVCQYILKS